MSVTVLHCVCIDWWNWESLSVGFFKHLLFSFTTDCFIWFPDIEIESRVHIQSLLKMYSTCSTWNTIKKGRLYNKCVRAFPYTQILMYRLVRHEGTAKRFVTTKSFLPNDMERTFICSQKHCWFRRRRSNSILFDENWRFHPFTQAKNLCYLPTIYAEFCLFHLPHF